MATASEVFDLGPMGIGTNVWGSGGKASPGMSPSI